jgi:hypothetical protein
VLNYPKKVEKLVLCSTDCGVGKSVPTPEDALGMVTAVGSALSPGEVPSAREKMGARSGHLSLKEADIEPAKDRNILARA